MLNYRLKQMFHLHKYALILVIVSSLINLIQIINYFQWCFTEFTQEMVNSKTEIQMVR